MGHSTTDEFRAKQKQWADNRKEEEEAETQMQAGSNIVSRAKRSPGSQVDVADLGMTDTAFGELTQRMKEKRKPMAGKKFSGR